MVIGKKNQLFSHVLKEERTIWIHLPERYDDTSKENEHCPVIYVLDAELNFLTTMGVQAALYRGGRSHIPDAILIGIQNTDRTRDLTPMPAISKRGQATLENSGGGEQFTSFWRKSYCR